MKWKICPTTNKSQKAILFQYTLKGKPKTIDKALSIIGLLLEHGLHPPDPVCSFSYETNVQWDEHLAHHSHTIFSLLKAFLSNLEGHIMEKN